MSRLFDEFSKSLSDQSLPRRETLRRLGVAITATVLSPLGIEFARAGGKHNRPHKPPPRPKPPQDRCKTFCKCRKGRQLDQCLRTCKACGSNPSRLGGSCGNYFCCGADQVSCGDYCADVATDPYNCGECGYQCDPPGPNEYGICVEGSCDYACYEGAEYCDGECAYLDWDANNCGACGNVCEGPDPHCSSGVCSECGSGQVVCDDTCTDRNWDSNNCGECGNVCEGETPYCNYGACTECPAGQSKCVDGGACIDLDWDSSNCGACGNVCPSYTYCYYGYCYYPYYGGYGGGGGYGWYGWY
jgi:hypothetical protein